MKNDKYEIKIKDPVIVVEANDNSFSTFVEIIDILAKKFGKREILFMETMKEKKPDDSWKVKFIIVMMF